MSTRLCLAEACRDGLVELKFGERQETLWVEIADTKQKREKGLMYRTFLPSDGGMLFVYDAPQRVRFWMKNTELPLDIVFLDSNENVVKVVSNTVPFSHDLIESGQEIKFVLEVNAGVAKKANLIKGLKFSGVDRIKSDFSC